MTAPHLLRRLVHQSDAAGETNDCTVIALAAVTGWDYDVAHRALEKAGRRPRRGCSPVIWLRALRSLNFSAVDIQPLTGGRAKTIRTAQRWIRKHGSTERFIIRSTGHVSAWFGGILVDTERMQRSLKRVDAIYLVQRD